MIDTVAIKHYLARTPTEEDLRSLNWPPRYCKHDGTIRAFIRNGQKGSTEPRLTLSLNPKMQWHLKAEVSLPKLLRGSNVPLLSESEIESSLRLLSEYVERWGGRKFDPDTALVCRVDFAKDIHVDESVIVPTIANFARVQIPRYDRTPHNDESVVFTPKGKSNNKRISVYNKLAEVRLRKGSEDEQHRARGILRLEVGLKTKAIEYLAGKLKLPSREAQHVLIPKVANYVLQDAMQKLQFHTITSDTNEVIEKLIAHFGVSRAKSLLGFIELRKHLGEKLYKQEYLNFPPRTYFRDLSDCRKAGVLP
jgi:hypothetical protein